MKKHHKLIYPLAILLSFALVLGACGAGSLAIVQINLGDDLPTVVEGGGPHFSASLTRYSENVAQSGWLELFLDEGSMTAQVRGFDDAEWFTLPKTSATPLANAGAAAVTLDIIVNGQRITLNSQDHSVAFDNAVGTPVFDSRDQPIGVRVDYLITPNEETARQTEFDETDVAFLVRVQYTMQDGNFFVEADWENASGNPNAFIETMGLMERFGALRNPGEDDFLLLPDGGGALLFPARANHTGGFPQAADLHFAVYGEDPTNPLQGENTSSQIFRDDNGNALSAHAAVFGARSRNTAFAAVIERGAAMATIIARQEIPGEQGIRQSAVGPRFTITPTTLSDNDSGTFFRAAESFGERDDEAEGFPIRICYRFFYGAGAANFSAMATSLREQLIITGILSPTKTVANPDWPLPLNLTLLGTNPETNQTLTTFEQALDILTRLKTRGIDNINVRYMHALSGSPERLRPRRPLGGRNDLATLQEYCHMTDMSLFLDAELLPGRGAADLTGNALPLRNMDGITRSVRGFINHLGPLQTAGFSLSDVGGVLYADYRAGLHREQTKAQLSQNLLPALSTQRLIMMDTGFFHVVRIANVVVNLPLTPQLQTGTGQLPRYEAVPLLPMILRGSVDYSGPALNLEDDPQQAFLHSIAFGACPALVWSAVGDDLLHFEAQLDDAVEFNRRANVALGDLRRERITSYAFDTDVRVSTTRFSNGAVIYVNFSDRDVILNDISIPAGDFVRIG